MSTAVPSILLYFLLVCNVLEIISTVLKQPLVNLNKAVCFHTNSAVRVFDKQAVLNSIKRTPLQFQTGQLSSHK